MKKRFQRHKYTQLVRSYSEKKRGGVVNVKKERERHTHTHTKVDCLQNSHNNSVPGICTFGYSLPT